MLRKTILALFAIAVVGMLSSAVASARGGVAGGGFHRGGGGGVHGSAGGGFRGQASRAVVAGVGRLAR
jgi:hypothetical protein